MSTCVHALGKESSADTVTALAGLSGHLRPRNGEGATESRVNQTQKRGRNSPSRTSDIRAVRGEIVGASEKVKFHWMAGERRVIDLLLISQGRAKFHYTDSPSIDR